MGLPVLFGLPLVHLSCRWHRWGFPLALRLSIPPCYWTASCLLRKVLPHCPSFALPAPPYTTLVAFSYRNTESMKLYGSSLTLSHTFFFWSHSLGFALCVNLRNGIFPAIPVNRDFTVISYCSSPMRAGEPWGNAGCENTGYSPI